MSKKLAITVSGAVSLGSFEAGVMYEVLYAIGKHNLAVNENDKIIIDVITGASAGGMTATILAQKLLFDAAALDDPNNNVLYRAWVQDVDISGLLATYPGDSDTKSIFSSGLVEEISTRYLTDPCPYGITPKPSKHPAVRDEMYLGLALSNLNGIDYGMNILPDGKFIYSRFQDQLTTSNILAAAKNNEKVFWEPLRQAAVSCGAFPFAFSPVELTRNTADFSTDDIDVKFTSPTQNFCYTDGGVFQNEPLGMAKNFVDIIDPTHVATVDRFYLFVSPDAKKSTASDQLTASNADFVPFATQLVGAIFNQARFQDWIMVDKFNSQIERFNERSRQLSNALAAPTVEADELAKTLQAASIVLLPLLFPGVDGPAKIKAAQDRLHQQFPVECARLGPAKQSTYIDAILVLETAAELGERDEMKILGITAEKSELAGADLFAFGGFFDVRYRDHDYDVGRKKAQEYLRSPACPLRIIPYETQPIRKINSEYDGLTLQDMEPAVKDEVYKRLTDRIMSTLELEHLDLIERELVYRLLIGPKIKKILKL